MSETAGGTGRAGQVGGEADVIIWYPWQQLGPGHLLCLLVTAYLAVTFTQLPGQTNFLLSPALEGWTML